MSHCNEYDSFIVLIDPNNLHSSAKENNSAKKRKKFNLFVKILNISGKRSEPCGTPEGTLEHGKIKKNMNPIILNRLVIKIVIQKSV